MSSDVVPQWTVYEAVLTSARGYDNPAAAVSVQIVAEAPSGRQVVSDAFWDGQQLWRLRLCAAEAGVWRWRSVCSDGANAGLHACSGQFEARPYHGENLLYRHGMPRLAPDRRFFSYADGTPFFWLGDTCWNGVLRADAADWATYLAQRQAQGFNVIQFIATTWRALATDALGETPFLGGEARAINPAFFQRLDAKVAAINAYGMLAAPILLHDNGPVNPGANLSEADAIRLARYMLARWGAYHMAVTLGGDGRYDGERMARWQRIGRAVFHEQPMLLATMHPEGEAWLGVLLQPEPWINFIGYQSGHGDNEATLRWLTDGPPTREWRAEPTRPLVNVEPNYEMHPAFHSRTPFSEREVRRALYWSLLVAPTAGVTYGHQWIWPWNTAPAEPDGHEGFHYGVVPPWHEAMQAPGAQQAALLRGFFEALAWWQLRPAQHLLRSQPGSDDPQAFVAAARATDGSFALVYTPLGHTLALDLSELQQPLRVTWFDPRSGAQHNAGLLNTTLVELAPPDRHDWLCWLAHCPQQ